MPRVNTATKNKAGKEIKCGRCGEKIEPGQKYFHYSFRYGGKHVRCSKHYPRPSELTQSKMSGAYAAIEQADDALGEERKNGNAEDIESILETCAEEIEGVRDEYQESLDNMPENFQQGQTGEEIQEKIETLEGFADSLRDVVIELPDEDAEDDEKEKAVEDAFENAENALQEFSL